MTSNISNSGNVYFFKNEAQKNSTNSNDNGYLGANLRNYVRKKSQVYIKPKEKIESEKAFKNLRRLIIINLCLIVAVIIYSSLGALMFQILEQHEELRRCEEGRGKFDKELKHYRDLIINYVTYNISSDELNYFTNFSRSPTNSINSNPIQINYKFGKYSQINRIPNTTYLDKELIEPLIEINKWLEEFRKKIFEIEANTNFHGQDCSKDTKWSFYASLLFSITVISTVGYGFIAPVTWEGRVVCICYASIGIPIYLVCLTNLSKKKGVNRHRVLKYDGLPLNDRKSFIVVPADNQSVTTSKMSSNLFLDNSKVAYEYSYYEDDDDEEENSQEDDEDEELSLYNDEVPFLLAFVIIIGYILFGGFLFSNFEGWTLTESVYFVYVTLTTMGFGDLVPGLALKDNYTDIKMLIVCIYSSFGMAIIGMCLGQMQFAIKRKQSMDFMNKSQNDKTSRKNSTVELAREKEEILNKIKMLKRLENESFNRKRRELNYSSNILIEKKILQNLTKND
ncbi:T family of potassium channels 18-like [Brachionus plicatilis]|uniref:T family of potassium channels 18-like n=1 Tax=Brachionus plicatilis TaxID=10195 RepID=A0A3M7RVK0_BRAPC|nr:T family of potassium channels 18-like [Brachionus plicatilis]